MISLTQSASLFISSQIRIFINLSFQALICYAISDKINFFLYLHHTTTVILLHHPSTKKYCRNITLTDIKLP
jgi:hypothetical protein